jgi:phosphatidylserine synthase
VLSTLVVAALKVSTVPTFSSKALSIRALRLYFWQSLTLLLAAVAGFLTKPGETLVIAAAVHVLTLSLSYWRQSIYPARTPSQDQSHQTIANEHPQG